MELDGNWRDFSFVGWSFLCKILFLNFSLRPIESYEKLMNEKWLGYKEWIWIQIKLTIRFISCVSFRVQFSIEFSFNLSKGFTELAKKFFREILFSKNFFFLSSVYVWITSCVCAKKSETKKQITFSLLNSARNEKTNPSSDKLADKWVL